MAMAPGQSRRLRGATLLKLMSKLASSCRSVFRIPRWSLRATLRVEPPTRDRRGLSRRGGSVIRVRDGLRAVRLIILAPQQGGKRTGTEAIPPGTNHCLFANQMEAYNFSRFSRRAFPITDTELNAIAAPAIMGLKRIPKNG
jgi:hypothetical protein